MKRKWSKINWTGLHPSNINNKLSKHEIPIWLNLVNTTISESLSCYLIKGSKQSQHTYYPDIQNCTMSSSHSERFILSSCQSKQTFPQCQYASYCERHMYNKDRQRYWYILNWFLSAVISSSIDYCANVVITKIHTLLITWWSQTTEHQTWNMATQSACLTVEKQFASSSLTIGLNMSS